MIENYKHKDTLTQPEKFWDVRWKERKNNTNADAKLKKRKG